MTAMGLLGGWVMRYQTEKNKAFYELLKAREASMDSAAKRDPNGGTWMRRAIYFFIVSLFMVAILAPFFGEPTVVENTVQRGILFWKKTVTEFVPIDGVLLPKEARQAFLLLCAFYLGQGVK